MPSIPVTETFYAANRAEWPARLSQHHTTKPEIWLISYGRTADKSVGLTATKPVKEMFGVLE